MFVRLLAITLMLALRPAWAATAFEQAQLTLILRQLDNIETLAAASAKQAPVSGERYRFDYHRLADDIQRVRAGVRDYLAPPRAQPHDPGELSASYRRENDSEEVAP